VRIACRVVRFSLPESERHWLAARLRAVPESEAAAAYALAERLEAGDVDMPSGRAAAEVVAVVDRAIDEGDTVPPGVSRLRDQLT
jgi:hypothetical protein